MDEKDESPDKNRRRFLSVAGSIAASAATPVRLRPLAGVVSASASSITEEMMDSFYNDSRYHPITTWLSILGEFAQGENAWMTRLQELQMKLTGASLTSINTLTPRDVRTITHHILRAVPVECDMFKSMHQYAANLAQARPSWLRIHECLTHPVFVDSEEFDVFVAQRSELAALRDIRKIGGMTPTDVKLHVDGMISEYKALETKIIELGRANPVIQEELARRRAVPGFGTRYREKELSIPHDYYKHQPIDSWHDRLIEQSAINSTKTATR